MFSYEKINTSNNISTMITYLKVAAGIGDQSTNLSTNVLRRLVDNRPQGPNHHLLILDKPLNSLDVEEDVGLVVTDTLQISIKSLHGYRRTRTPSIVTRGLGSPAIVVVVILVNNRGDYIVLNNNIGMDPIVNDSLGAGLQTRHRGMNRDEARRS